MLSHFEEDSDYFERLSEQLAHPEQIYVLDIDGKAVKLIDLSTEKAIEFIRMWVGSRIVPIRVIKNED